MTVIPPQENELLDYGRILELCRQFEIADTDDLKHALESYTEWREERFRRINDIAIGRGEPPAEEEPSLVAGVYMDRSIADFRRACEVHIDEEQRRPNPDTALIALLCDAVRLSREFILQVRRISQP